MLTRFLNWLKGKGIGKETGQKAVTADGVRKYTKATYITPARQKKGTRVTFTSGEIHKGMGLHSSFAQVCRAIDAKKFQEFARVKLIKREGVKNGATAKWTFKLN